jgi:hypothetical protein
MKSAFEDPNRPSLLSIVEQDINNKIGSGVPIKLQFKLSDVEALLGVPQKESPVEALLKASDADANGFLTLRESQNFLLNFAKKIVDTDHDGFVTEKEFDAIMMGWQFKVGQTRAHFSGALQNSTCSYIKNRGEIPDRASHRNRDPSRTGTLYFKIFRN